MAAPPPNARVRNVDVAAEDIAGLVSLAKSEKVGLTIIGPEGPLVIGVVDAFAAAGLRCFGPRQAAAQLEGSKAYTKEFLKRHGIPTAAYATFRKETFDPDWVRRQRTPIVVKASGLAAGKGVVIVESADEAIATAQSMFGGQFGSAGDQVVIEEFLPGEEASFIVMADGRNILAFATSQDHKRLRDADAGPNTGGMGAYSPAPVVTRAMHERIMREVIEPTIRGLAKDGTPYTGFLYAGIMVHPDGTPNVLEYNCRFGDPETQPIMMRLRSDLVELCEAALDHRLDAMHAEWDERAALGVVLAAEGYPDRRAQRRCHRRARSRGQTTRQGVPRRHARRRRQSAHPWRPRVVRGGIGRQRLGGAGAGLCARRCDPLAGHAMPARYRLSRHRERKSSKR